MDGEIYSRTDLEGMPNWVGTFKHVVCIASVSEHVVCLMKQPRKGYWWKTPGKGFSATADLDNLQNALKQGRMELVSGKLPRGVQRQETNLMKCLKKPRRREKVAV